MARFCTLHSGSGGNSTYIGCGESGIIIDAGASAKSIAAGLAEHNIEMSEVGAILVTHEHGDHVNGLRVLATRHNIDVYASPGTLSALEASGKINQKCNTYSIGCEKTEIAGMGVTAFCTSHDCAQSMGYIIHTPDGRKIAVCTDLGYVSEEVRAALLGCDLIMLESNHDTMMLQNGSYPYPLKRRILSDVGHLSNALCAQELGGLIEAGATRIVLAHLSKENNHPELALATARSELCGLSLTEGKDYLLSVAAQKGGKMIIL